MRESLRPCAMVVAMVGLLGGAGCSSAGGTAIRTGPLRLPSHVGAVTIYASEAPPVGATDLGVVEVHALNEDGTVDALLPLFVQKVAQIGGNVAVIDGLRARFDTAQRMMLEHFYFACGYGMTCSGTRVYTTNDELMLVSLFGHAMTTNAVAPPPAPPLPSGPLLPPAPPGGVAPAPSSEPQQAPSASSAPRSLPPATPPVVGGGS